MGSVALLISPAQLKPRGQNSLVQLPFDHSGSDSSPGRRRAPVIAHSFIEVYLPGCYGLFYGETRGFYKNTGSVSGCHIMTARSAPRAILPTLQGEKGPGFLESGKAKTFDRLSRH